MITINYFGPRKWRHLFPWTLARMDFGGHTAPNREGGQVEVQASPVKLTCLQSGGACTSHSPWIVEAISQAKSCVSAPCDWVAAATASLALHLHCTDCLHLPLAPHLVAGSYIAQGTSTHHVQCVVGSWGQIKWQLTWIGSSTAACSSNPNCTTPCT
jgi:hypothetical protein